MRNRKWYEWLLSIVYIAMISVCVYLNVYSDQYEGTASIVVNVIMFILVGLIFLSCDIGSFFPMNSIITELNKATEKIRKDAMNSHSFLWDQYQKDQVQIFSDKHLKDLYEDYLFELKRVGQMNNADKAYYKCKIDDFINYELVDSVMHRNQLNQVAGVMTGLGILGTFVGLSLGLKSFNTVSTAEITNSITPLMNGIKVAFHTSIYGMVFSLVFNYVYKRKLDEAETAVQRFLNAYKKYVLPDLSDDGINRLIELEQTQADTLLLMDKNMPSHLKEVLDPAFEDFSRTLHDYTAFASRSQLKALSDVVNAFISELNKSMSGAFSQLSETVDKEYEAQKTNARLMQDLLEEVGGGKENIAEINRGLVSVLSSLDGFGKKVSEVHNEMDKELLNLKVQSEITLKDMKSHSENSLSALKDETDSNLSSLKEQSEKILGAISDQTEKIISTLRIQSENNQEILEQERKYLTDLANYRHSLDAFAEHFNESLKTQEQLLSDIRTVLQKLPRDLGNTLNLLDDSLEDVELRMQRLSDSISKNSGQITPSRRDRNGYR